MPRSSKGGVDRLIRLDLSNVAFDVENSGIVNIPVPAKEWPHDQWSAFIGSLLEDMKMSAHEKAVFQDTAGDAIGKMLDYEILKGFII